MIPSFRTLTLLSLFSLPLACAAPGTQALAPNAVAVRDSCLGGVVSEDAELATYAGCRRIVGDFRVEQVSSLYPLGALQVVDGTLTIRNTAARSLEGLEQLSQVRELSVEHNNELDDVSSLINLRGAQALRFSDNPDLAALPYLYGVQQLDQLVVERTGVRSLAGAERLTHVRRIVIRQNPKLITLAALANVQRSDEVVLEGNARLCGRPRILPALQAPPTRLTVHGNGGLFAADTVHLTASSPEQVIAAR